MHALYDLKPRPYKCRKDNSTFRSSLCISFLGLVKYVSPYFPTKVPILTVRSTWHACPCRTWPTWSFTLGKATYFVASELTTTLPVQWISVICQICPTVPWIFWPTLDYCPLAFDVKLLIQVLSFSIILWAQSCDYFLVAANFNSYAVFVCICVQQNEPRQFHLDRFQCV